MALASKVETQKLLPATKNQCRERVQFHNHFIYSPSLLSLEQIKIMGPMLLSQLATGLSVLAGAVLVKSVMDQKPMAGPFTRCPTCNGTGRVTCLCSRWSDGDVGCSTCSGSGRMACSSCGGSGTGRPLPAKIAIRPPNRPIN